MCFGVKDSIISNEFSPYFSENGTYTLKKAAQRKQKNPYPTVKAIRKIGAIYMLAVTAKRCHDRDYLVVFYRALLECLVVAAHYIAVGIDADHTVQNEGAVFSTVKRHVIFFQLADGLF